MAEACFATSSAVVYLKNGPSSALSAVSALAVWAVSAVRTNSLSATIRFGPLPTAGSRAISPAIGW